MSVSYTKIKIGDMGRVITGKTPPTKRQELYGKKHPFITPTDITDNSRIVTTERFLSEKGFQYQEQLILPKGTICFVCIASIGKMCIVTQPSFTNQQINSIIVDSNKCDNRFVYYLLRNDTRRIKLLAGGVAAPIINKSAFSEIEVTIPPLGYQSKVASILSAYDDLIENNNSRIKILEQMAQTVYDEWFVKFRFPGHSKVKMVDSELGKIPEGWHTETVEKIIDFHIGGGWGKETMDDKHCDSAYVIRGTDIPLAKNLCIDNCPLRYHTESNLKKRRLEDNDIILEVSGGSYDQPVGRALILSKQLHSSFNEDVICASFCKRIKIKSDVLNPYIFLLHLETIYENRKIEKYQVQSTGIKNFKFDFFLKQENLLIPTGELQKQFVNIIQPLMEQKDILGAKNSIFSKSRDMLLPKLISGEIDIENMDIDVGDTDDR